MAANSDPVLLCLTAAQRFYSDPNDGENAKRLSDALALLYNQSTEPRQYRLTSDEASFTEFVSYSPIFLAAAYTPSAIRDRLQALLFNFAWYDLKLRRYIAGELQLCSSVFSALKISLREQKGPQSLIESLRLLQILSYDEEAKIGASWASDLISFLLNEICRDKPTVWMPYCLGILCNFATKSKAVRERVKRSSNYANFCRKIVKFLAHDSVVVVVCSLTLVGYLEEQLKNTVYSAKNMTQTFQCLFNVLVKGDDFMARHFASDLLRRLVVDEEKCASSSQDSYSTVTRPMGGFGKELQSFPHLDRSIQQVASLLVTIDDTTETLSKVYDCLLVFCSVEALRHSTCQALLQCGPVEPRLRTPLLAMTHAAEQNADASPLPGIPLRAARLLQIALREIIDTNQTIQTYVPPDKLLNLVEQSVKTTVETASDLVTFQCRRIVEGLGIAEVVCWDEEMRGDLLEVVRAPLCAHVAEFQMLTNPVVSASFSHRQTAPDLPEWSLTGVEIVVELLRLLHTLKDYSKAHKDQYWRLLKDDRLIPFVAFAMTCGKAELINSALDLSAQCFQIHDFPSARLSEQIARNWEQNQRRSAKNALQQQPGVNLVSPDGVSQSQSMPLIIAGSPASKMLSNGDGAYQSSVSIHDVDETLIDQLLEKMKNGVHLEDGRISQLVQVYERKIQTLQRRERTLQEALESKQTSLVHSERLLSQSNGSKNETEKELAQLRAIVRDCEQRSETAIADANEAKRRNSTVDAQLAAARNELEKRVKQIDSFKGDYEQRLSTATQQLEMSRREVSAARSEIESLKKELEGEKQLQLVMRQRYVDMKTDFETTTKRLFEVENERNAALREIEEVKGHSAGLADLTVKLENLLATKEEVISKYEVRCANFDQLRTEFNQKEKNFRKQFADFEASNQKLNQDLEEQKKVTAMIRKLTEGKL